MTSSPPRMVPTWILRVLGMIGILLCLPWLVIGIIVVAVDAHDRSDDLHGLGMVLGGALAVASAVALLGLALLVLMLFKWPRVGLWTTAVLSGLTALGFLGMGFLSLADSLGSDDVIGAAVFGGGALVIVGLAVWGLVPVPRTNETSPYGDLPR